MIAYILKVTLCWLFFYGVYELFLKKRTFFTANRSYLLATLVGGILLPLLEFIPWKNEANLSYVIYPVLMEIDDLQAVAVAQKEEVFNWFSLLYLIYAVGLIVSLTRLIMGLKRILSLYSNSQKINKKSYTVVLTEKPHMPFSFFKWVFFSSKVSLTSEVESILKHEVEHIKGRHSLDIIALELLKVVFWCSPMIYFYKNALKEVHEFLADRVVVKESNKNSYKKLLLAQTNSSLQMALTHQFFNSHLKNRIKMINQKRSGRPTLVMYALGIPVLLLLLFAFTYSFTPNEEDMGAEKLELSNEEKIPDLPFNLYYYSNETDQPKMPYIQVNGEDITYPLSDHVDLTAPIGSICSYVPKYALDMYGDKAKLGYINIQDPVFKKESMDGESIWLLQTRLDTLPKSSSESQVYKVVEKMPRFPGCENVQGTAKEKEDCAKKKMLEFIYTSLRYPKEDREAGVQGMSVVQFVINSRGEVENAKIIRSISDATSKEVMRIVDAMANMDEKWTPGYQSGKAVSVQFTLPIRFKLQGDEKEEKQDLEEAEAANSVEFENIYFLVDGNESDESTYEQLLNDDMVADVKIHTTKEIVQTLTKAEEYDAVFEVSTAKGMNKPEEFNGNELPLRRSNEIEIENVVETMVVVGFGESKDLENEEEIVIQRNSGENPLYVLDGKIIQKESFEDIEPDDIEKINVLKGEAADKKYGDKGANGVVEVTLKPGSKERIVETEDGKKILLKPIDAEGQPLFVINGEISTSPEKEELNPDDIEKINVLKGEAANKKYGDKGVNGAVEITTKGHKVDYEFDTPAYFPGCENMTNAAEKENCSKQKLLTYIYTNVKYPKEAAKEGIQGVVVSSFIIGEDGKIRNIKLKRDVKKISDAALKVVAKMADEITWEPAMKDGKAVAMEFNLPIKFKLADDTPKKVESKIANCDDIEDEKERRACREEKSEIVKKSLEALEREQPQENALELRNLSLSPNPAHRMVNLRFEGQRKPISMQLLNVEGKTVYSRKLADFDGVFDEQIDLSDLDAKMLILRIEQEGRFYVEKLVIE